MSNYIVLLVVIAVFIIAIIKRVNCYDAFLSGAGKSLSLSFSLFPYVCAVLVMVSLLRVAGVGQFLTGFLAPVLSILRIPPELFELVVLRPFSGSGSIALLDDIFANYGADSYIGRCASVVLSSSETVLYVSAVYLAPLSLKNTGKAILVALLCTFLGSVLACHLCLYM